MLHSAKEPENPTSESLQAFNLNLN